jgi:hypothetical protein
LADLLVKRAQIRENTRQRGKRKTRRKDERRKRNNRLSQHWIFPFLFTKKKEENRNKWTVRKKEKRPR